MADDSLSLLFRIRGDSSGARAETKALERQIATLKDRIKEVRTESGVPFKTERLAALQTQLRALTTQHKELKAAAAVSAKAHEDFSGALSTLSPRLGGLAASLGGAVGPLTAVAAGLVAIGGAAVAIFEATKSVAEFQGKLFDLSQQTGVNVETLSALEILAKTTGGSIDSITASLGIFQKNLEDAQDPTSKEAKLLKELGVETKNTEHAFRQTLTALAAMPTGFQQTSRALELFGRGGKSILAILKEMDGDLDGAIQKFREMGILIDTDTAKAADQFNDQLAMVQFQLRGVVALVGREAMPTILSAVQQVSKALVDNRQIISQWATSIGDAGRGALILGGYLARLGGIITGLSNIPIPMIIRILGSISGATGILTGLAGIGAANRGPQVGGTATLGAGLTPGVGRVPSISGGGGGGGGGADRISEGQRLLNQLTDEYNRLQEKANELSKVKIVALEILDSKYKNLSPTLRDQIFQQAALIDQAKQQADSDKRKAEATEKIRALLNSQTEAIRNARIGEEQWTDQIVKLEVELKKLGLTMDANTRKLLMDNAATQQALALTRERIALEQTRIDRMERDRLATPERKQEQLEREQGIERSTGEETRSRTMQAVDEDRSAIDQLYGAINDNLSGETQTAALAGLDALTSAFQGLGQAVGAVVEAWVLYGSAGTSVRKVTAQILAGVAQQAAVKAVFELAEGFAALAMAFFGVPNAGPSASAHFTAAAIYGSIAAVAAVAGRAVAGDAFKQQASGGTGSGGNSRTGGGSSSSDRPGKPEARDVNRNAIAQPIHVTVQLHGDIATDALQTRVVNSMVQALDLNDDRLTVKIQDAAKRGR